MLYRAIPGKNMVVEFFLLQTIALFRALSNVRCITSDIKSNHEYPGMGSSDHKSRRCPGRPFCTIFFFCARRFMHSLRFWSLSTITKVLNPLRLISLSLTSARCETLAGATGSKLGEPSIPQRSKHSPVPSIRRSPQWCDHFIR